MEQQIHRLKTKKKIYNSWVGKSVLGVSGFLLLAGNMAIAGPGDKTAKPAPKAATKAATVPGVTFAEPLYGENSDETIYVPVRTAANAMGWNVSAEGKKAFINGKPLDVEDKHLLLTGSWIIPVRSLEKWGATVQYNTETRNATVSANGRSATVTTGKKRVELDLDKQELRAYQGDLLVLKSEVSTGRQGNRTPAGNFEAGPYKAEMHYSTIYDNAPMPWSVQINGDIFVHGFKSVPDYPASHGCIRLPLNQGNPAKWFYHWVDRGTPVAVNR
ncbi:MAG: hypothetical protein OHK0029_14170 [Armatimonadaceae bacterium]